MSVRPTIMVITACPLFTTGPLDFFISDLGCTNLEDSKIPEFGSAGEHAKLNLSWIGFSWKNETTSSRFRNLDTLGICNYNYVVLYSEEFGITHTDPNPPQDIKNIKSKISASSLAFSNDHKNLSVYSCLFINNTSTTSLFNIIDSRESFVFFSIQDSVVVSRIQHTIQSYQDIYNTNDDTVDEFYQDDHRIKNDNDDKSIICITKSNVNINSHV